ncbi:tRNA 2-thiouridine(34) synthase MnmA [Halosquirtibacter xylanolyticus]|uniref:tRNA 2-thiouridine(34) synthase MnmA n=1 Tax=Halosquirtibacter xylanolyticus TaxID=3374599 RepID=UPI0037494019|nr:tRNA 2-thiouridine(34) synthase MnmA [Prolixibacteraceae bacterium]
MKKKVVVGLSGGVDSSVAAHLLKQDGYDVIGVFMINYKDTVGTLTSSCTWEDDVEFASMIANKLDIPFHVVDLSEHYKERVIDYMFSEYEAGRTPNPDVLCNREMKFDVFMDKALELGADYVATGHYCQKSTITIDGKEYSQLIAGEDQNKDQSYFLCQLSQDQLNKTLFPIGHLEKPKVREIAREAKLITAERKDSQGICFVGKVDLPTFLQQKLEPKKGNVIEIPNDFTAKKRDFPLDKDHYSKHCFAYPYKPWNGKVVGEHNGAHFYTIGQRKGLNIGGYKEPLFIIGTDVKRNIVYVGEGKKHAGLYRQGLFIEHTDMHWIRPDMKLEIGQQKEMDFRIRYRQPLEKATMYIEEDGVYVLFENPQRGITAGQFAAWYVNNELIGSGTIK